MIMMRRGKTRYKILEGSYPTWLYHHLGTMRFDLRAIAHWALVCTGYLIIKKHTDVLIFVSSITSLTGAHSPMQIKHPKRK